MENFITLLFFCSYWFENQCIGGKTKCVKMNETLNQWKAL